MNRLRTLSNDYLLPLVISALVLRALIPMGFMPGSGSGMTLTAMLCNTSPTAAPRTESIEIPGIETPADMAAMHCDYCLVPVLGAAYAQPAIRPPVEVCGELLTQRADAPTPRFALDRAQIPRAPPLS